MDAHVLESNHGWKVVLCKEKPQGGTKNPNWILLQDGLKKQEAIDYAKRFNNDHPINT